MSPLSIPLEGVLRLTAAQKAALERAGISTVRDLLYYFPARYESFSAYTAIAAAHKDEKITVAGTVVAVSSKRIPGRRMALVEVAVRDTSGTMRALWFNQPYIAKTFAKDMRVRLSGKVHESKKGFYFVNPLHEILADDAELITAPHDTETPIPVYPETRGLSSRWFQFAIKKIIPLVPPDAEMLPADILKRYHLAPFPKALKEVHAPETLTWAEGARKRFAFEEIFLMQLTRARERKRREHEQTFVIPPAHNETNELIARLPFDLTNAQKNAVENIIDDFARPHPMARLLEGDVGSGKTLVAVLAALAVHRARYQVAYMAPTEILARQHFDEFCKHLRYFRATMGLLTSSECRKFPSKVDPAGSTHISRVQLLKWVEDGTIDILIGTHALIQKSVSFKNLALVIVDEQHRFGVTQRAQLARQAKRPHFLSMTATPIPRTLALTIYSDLDLSLLDEMPPGRVRPITNIVPKEKRAEAYAFIRSVIARGEQAFVICPKIETKEDGPPKRMELKAVKDEYKKLSKDIFPEFIIEMLHGKMKPKEKESIVQRFRDKETDILVSTSVVEVGMDIPNASVMIIEGADRFGLASLHQFRGRVGRRGQQSYCFLFTESKNQKTMERLKALEKARNGFELAEYDLALRGAGELTGSSQWGVSDIGMEALKNMKLVEAARTEAARLVEEDADLKKYPPLAERISAIEKQELHFE